MAAQPAFSLAHTLAVHVFALEVCAGEAGEGHVSDDLACVRLTHSRSLTGPGIHHEAVKVSGQRLLGGLSRYGPSLEAPENLRFLLSGFR